MAQSTSIAIDQQGFGRMLILNEARTTCSNPGSVSLHWEAVRKAHGFEIRFIFAIALVFFALPTAIQSQQVHIRIFNAKTNKPVIDERLNVALRAEQIGSVAMPTDKTGLIVVESRGAATIRILANMYGDCRPRSELYTDYSVATIIKTGIVTGNLCSGINLPPKPGELLLFEIPKTYIPAYPNGPATNLPHSGEPPTAY